MTTHDEDRSFALLSDREADAYGYAPTAPSADLSPHMYVCANCGRLLVVSNGVHAYAPEAGHSPVFPAPYDAPQPVSDPEAVAAALDWLRDFERPEAERKWRWRGRTTPPTADEAARVFGVRLVDVQSALSRER